MVPAPSGSTNSMRPEYGKVSSPGSTIWTVWPCAPVDDSCARVLRTSAIGLQKSEITAISESADGRKDGGRLARSVTSCTIAFAILSSTLRLPVGRIRPGMPTRRPSSPWMTVAAIRRDSRIRRGMDSASERASPLACWVALISFLSARRCAAIRLSDAGLELVDDGFRVLAVGARREGECHAVLEDRLGHFDDVVDRGRQPPVDEGAGARHQHQRLAGARARSPGDQLAEVAGLRTGTRRAHQPQDRLHHRFADRQAAHPAP